VPSVADDGWAIGLVRTGRAWDTSLALGQQQMVGEHMAYLGRLMEAGEVTQAGPVIELDHGPGDDGLIALIVYAVGAERARELATADPAVRNGLIELDVRPWYAAA
jgi:uncharacterized protein YciI